MTDEKKVEVVFAPGAFDEFEGTQEELDNLIAKITEMANNGELEQKAIELEDLPEKELIAIIKHMLGELPDRDLH